MPVHHGRAASVLGSPVQTHGQAVLVALAGRVAVEGELADGSRPATLHLGLQAGMRYDEPAAVEDVVRDEAVEPCLELVDQRAAIVGRHAVDFG